MRKKYNKILGKYGISSFQLCLVLLFCRHTANYTRKTPTVQCSKKRPLVFVVRFLADESVFCDLEEIFQISLQTLKLASAHVL